MKISKNKPYSIHLRLTDSQYSFCLKCSEFMGIGVSDFIRMSLDTMFLICSCSPTPWYKTELTASDTTLPEGDYLTNKPNEVVPSA